MKQHDIPCIFMRGGTSRGPYFNRGDLPEDRDTLARVLIAALGATMRVDSDWIPWSEDSHRSRTTDDPDHIPGRLADLTPPRPAMPDHRDPTETGVVIIAVTHTVIGQVRGRAGCLGAPVVLLDGVDGVLRHGDAPVWRSASRTTSTSFCIWRARRCWASGRESMSSSAIECP